jgi:hypothetical protein
MGLILKYVSDIFNENDIIPFTVAHADVAGMGYPDLAYDRVFIMSVKHVVESCQVDGDEIDCYGY